jgi:predicted phage gp36 major capsid-like protein
MSCSKVVVFATILKVTFSWDYFCYNRIMERDILSQVIEAEKEIQQCLDLEKIKAREWLERVKKECEEEFIREDKKIKEALEKATAEAAREAGVKAAGAVSRAAAASERLGRLQTKALSRIVAKQIAGILPG